MRFLLLPLFIFSVNISFAQCKTYQISSKGDTLNCVDYKGMNVEQVTSLRKKLSSLKSEMKVVRNTLAIRALKDHPASEKAIADDLVGTNAFVFAYDDVTASAKALSEVSKEIENLKLKSGVMDGEKLDAKKITHLATLPSKEALS